MDFLGIFVSGFLIVLIALIALWLLSLKLEDSGIVDIFWGPGFVLIAWFYFSQTAGFETRKWLLILFVTLWGMRLAWHIGRRNIGKDEDYRYRQWREENGARWWWFSFFKVFLLQGVLLWIISLPLLGAQISPTPATLTIFDYIAIPVWLFGFIFEAVGDWQLATFKANPANKGKVLNTGLWRFTRHPNYFGDAVQWWAYFLFALAAGYGWTIISPLVMTYLLVRVSGVRMLEKSLKTTKPEYAEYIRRTSAFVPMPPRKSN